MRQPSTRPLPTTPRHRIPGADRNPPFRQPSNASIAKDIAMAKQRISYVPLEKMTPKMRQEMERCQREGTPRPESSAVRAHVEACFWFFADSWNNIFRNGVLDHAIKELCRLMLFQESAKNQKQIGRAHV